MSQALKLRPLQWPEIGMGAATLVCLILAPVGAIGALFSPLIFDNRANFLNPLAWLGFLLMIGFWIICLLAPYAAWVVLLRKQATLAWAAISVPLAWLLVLAAVLQFVPG